VTEARELVIGGRRLRLTNPDKILWPGSRFTKADLLAYHLQISPVILDHIRARPLTLGRWPDGVEEEGWIQTSCHNHPEWMRTHPVPRQRGTGPGRDYCVIEDEAGLAWLSNLGTIELHPLLSAVPEVERPLVLVVDLDPGPGTGPPDVAAVALEVRAALHDAGLTSLVKTSGARGLHVVVPLARGPSYADTKWFARALAEALARRRPDRVTARMGKAERLGRIFVDWSQNDQHKSTVAAYSLRAMAWPSPSLPITWDEVEAAAVDRLRLRFDAADVPGRLDRLGDLHASASRGAGGQHLPDPSLLE
jgi:bifunctional non-homologous end joining protein LigD